VPQLYLVPKSGPRNSDITISGQYFAPLTQYLVYWDTPGTQIGLVNTDSAGRIAEMVFAVPGVASLGKHQVVAELGGDVVARAPFTVTD
jgi:hypothetical protein